MKFLAILILSLSLLTTSTFAVSLTPPQVYAVKEDRSMASNVDTSNAFSPLNALVAGTSIGLTVGGLAFALIGASSIGDNSPQDRALMAIGGLGLMGLGIFGMVWTF